MVAQGKDIHSDKKAIAGIRGNPQNGAPKNSRHQRVVRPEAGVDRA
jgi:hypothetical protein